MIERNVLLEVRHTLAQLPRAPQHPPGQPVKLEDVFIVSSHRGALDPDRPLVVGNRGMGKSFWAHALINEQVREQVARRLGLPALLNTEVVIGFNGSERVDGIAPTAEMLDEVMAQASDKAVWQAVLARAVAPNVGVDLPTRFADVVGWVQADAERVARLFTQADDTFHKAGKRLLLVFDGLDRVAARKRADVLARLPGLAQLAVAVQSFRALRVKLFIRNDHKLMSPVWAFADSSKLVSAQTDLVWSPDDLYQLLFHHLRNCRAFIPYRLLKVSDRQRLFLGILAPPYMGRDKRKGIVESWLPTHLADANGQIAPRTFLTAWREAACHGQCPADTAVDRDGLHEGVRCASTDRMTELNEEFPFVCRALETLRDRSVPMQQQDLFEAWQADPETQRIIYSPAGQLEGKDPMQMFLEILQIVGVLEVRRNGKVDVPDIFRVAAGIKRRGGVKPPRKPSAPAQ